MRRNKAPSADGADLPNDVDAALRREDEDISPKEERAKFTAAAGQLRAFIERVERLTEERQAISDDIKEVYAEMKGNGFDVTAVRALVRLRRMDQAERQEREAILNLYKSSLGMG